MQINQVAEWGVYCDIPDGHSAMTVQIGFSHTGAEFDETEFCITSWNAQELSELFREFCNENGFGNAHIQYVSVVRTATTLDELAHIEEQI